ncbi:MAG: TIGR01777 family oxidoreductase [Gemmatimonadaceae bacterium]|nr:TIGR01777 family oxidoreductase [Gemmatimonadaceae bacterium]
MRIGVTGASGFLGQRLVPTLRAAGHEVVRIGRGADSDVPWNPTAGTIDPAGCAGIDAFVHLAGASVGQRWTPAHRREIRDSRVQGTALIARTAAALTPRSRVLVCASAVGIYGNAGDAVLDESSPAGSDFLADIGREWEAAADPARQAGVRTVHLRFGVVLSRRGGALARMLPIFLVGGGGRLASGRQWMSWVSMEDAVGAVQFALERETLTGAVNAVAPSPVTNAEFTATLARVVHRPALFPVPAFALNLMFGEMAQGTLLTSQRVIPRQLLAAGYAFRHATLEPALRAAVNE